MKLHHSHSYHLPRLAKLKYLFWERAFSAVGTALVGIFIPIYLLELGYSIQAILLLFALMGCFIMLLLPLGFWCLTKFGAYRTMVLGNLGHIIFFVLLLSLESHAVPIWTLAVFRGLYSALYFPAFHATFITARAHTGTGGQIGALNALSLALHGIAPAIGGILAVYFGLPFVYALALLMIIIGSAPLLRSNPKASWPALKLSDIPFKQSGKDFWADGFLSIFVLVEVVIWPLLISLVIGSYAYIGLLSSLVMITSIAISLYVGKREDKVGERRYLDHGIKAGLASDIAKLFLVTPIGIFIVNILSGVSSAFIMNAFTSRYYKNADIKNMLGYMFGMELLHAGLWATYFLVLALLSNFISLNELLWVAVVLGIPSLFGVRLMHTGERPPTPPR